MKLIGQPSIESISMGHGKYHGYVTNNQRLYVFYIPEHHCLGVFF